MKPKIWRLSGLLGSGLIIYLVISIALQLNIPKPNGPFGVGRTHMTWIDTSRSEGITANPADFRNVPIIVWYPIDADKAAYGPYYPNLERVAQNLIDSGEVSPIEVYGLRFIKSIETLNAPITTSGTTSFPVVIFSPGNGTNMEFYSGIADELASYGYIIVGINHPYDVASVELQDGSIAQFVPGPMEFEQREVWVTDRIAVRTADSLFVLQKLADLNNGDDRIFAGRIDLTRIAIMGHSLGGITAAESCRADARFLACLNLDGMQRGGPFSTNENPTPPIQPFMLITKEPQISPKSIALFKSIPAGSFLIEIHRASHDNFTDGPLLLPTLLPIPNEADQILSLIRRYTLAFFDQTLKQQPDPILVKSSQDEWVSMEIFPPQ